jgi:uncharacterized phosphosugar-binding protein
MSAEAYFTAVQDALRRVATSQMAGIRTAAQMLTDAIVQDRSLYSFGATHSFMVTEELVYRTGGLMLINPIYPHGMNLSVRPMTATSRLERVVGLGAELLSGSPARSGDVLLLASTSGRNAVVIDMALEARRKGLKTIGITALAYSSGVTSRHPSGKKLADLCDLILDNGAPYGDAAVSIPGLAQKTGPLSSITSLAIVNAMVAETVRRLAEMGRTPPVFMSANLDGGDEFNARLLKENQHRIHYMD